MHLHALAKSNAIKIGCVAIEWREIYLYSMWRNVKNKTAITSTSTVNVALQRSSDYFILFIPPTYIVCLPFLLIFNAQSNDYIIMLTKIRGSFYLAWQLLHGCSHQVIVESKCFGRSSLILSV